MKSKKFDAPQLFVRNAKDIQVSSENLPILMRAVIDKDIPFRFCARGNSMRPFIQNGDVITVRPFSSASPKIGDVIAFMEPETGKLVVHRIVAKRIDKFLIRGDNFVCKSDGMIPKNNLIGRVVCVERNGRWIKLGFGPERFIIALISLARLILSLFKRKVAIIFHSSRGCS